MYDKSRFVNIQARKDHLAGASDTENINLRLTLANNYYKDSMDRMPGLGGYAHVYNTIMMHQYI